MIRAVRYISDRNVRLCAIVPPATIAMTLRSPGGRPQTVRVIRTCPAPGPQPHRTGRGRIGSLRRVAVRAGGWYSIDDSIRSEKRPSVPALPRPATLIAIAALVVASSGGAFAAGSLINGASIKNGSIPGSKLEPHTLSGLQINVARLGTVPLPTLLPHHQSLSGLYAVEGTGHVNQSAVSFLIPLASAPVAHFVAPGARPPPQCPGSVAHPKAAPANVCVFAFDLSSGVTPQVFDPLAAGSLANRLGFGIALYQPSENVGTYVYSSGTWAVTAP